MSLECDELCRTRRQSTQSQPAASRVRSALFADSQTQSSLSTGELEAVAALSQLFHSSLVAHWKLGPRTRHARSAPTPTADWFLFHRPVAGWLAGRVVAALARAHPQAGSLRPAATAGTSVCPARLARYGGWTKLYVWWLNLFHRDTVKAAVHWVRVNALSAESSPKLTWNAMGLRAGSARWLSVRAEPLTR